EYPGAHECRRRADAGPPLRRRPLPFRQSGHDRVALPRRPRGLRARVRARAPGGDGGRCGRRLRAGGRDDRRRQRPRRARPRQRPLDPPQRRAGEDAAPRHRGPTRYALPDSRAELLGARVHGEPVYRRVNFPGNHALWRGGLFPTPAAVGKALDESDAVLIVGASVFTWFLHTEGVPFRRGLAVVQVDDDPWEIGRSYPVSLGIVADPRETLAELTRTISARMGEAERKAARERVETIGQGRAEIVARTRAAAEAEAARPPIGQAHLMHTLASLVP